MSQPLLSDDIFTSLKARLEADAATREDLVKEVQALETSNQHTLGLLSRIHATHSKDFAPFFRKVRDAIWQDVVQLQALAVKASQQPYYKYNHLWSRTVENVLYTMILTRFFGGLYPSMTEIEPKRGELLTMAQIGEITQVPVQAPTPQATQYKYGDMHVLETPSYEVLGKDEDAFHITLEEYLLAVTRVTDELARYSTNCVILQDVAMATLVAQFVRDVFAGFQALNLKNDILRKRVDGVKYSVKKVEEVVYDLSLRGMLPASAADNEHPIENEE